MSLQSLANRAGQLQTLLQKMEISSLEEITENDEIQPQNLDCHLAVNLLAQARKDQSNVYLIGNGGSAAIVSHAKTDLMNVGKIKAITLHESAIMTCMANDYGYENVFSRQLKVLASPQDVLIAVSSSGQSANILQAVQVMKNLNAKTITLSGFLPDNPLRKMGNLNYWIDSENYTLVEIAHLFILHHIADCLKNE